MHPAWLAESYTKGHSKHFRDIAKLNCVPSGNIAHKQCIYCNIDFVDQLDHFFHQCTKYSATREVYWSTIINSCSTELSAYVYNLPDEDISAVILGKRPCFRAADNDMSVLFEIGARVWQVLAYDSNLRFYWASYINHKYTYIVLIIVILLCCIYVQTPWIFMYLYCWMYVLWHLCIVWCSALQRMEVIKIIHSFTWYHTLC